jgi:AAA domain
MTELLLAVASWQTLLFVLIVFGFAPGFVLRLLVRLYPPRDPRRRELVSELYAMDRIKRPLFVVEQLETVLFEGLPHRLHALRQPRTSLPVAGNAHRYLQLLDRAISATWQVENGSRRAEPLPYHRRYVRPWEPGVYAFEVHSQRLPVAGALVELDGNPSSRGSVVRVETSRVFVRFHTGAVQARIPLEGALRLVDDVGLESKQRQAVAVLREHRCANRHLLSLLADHAFRPYACNDGRPWYVNDLLDGAHCDAVSRACAVPDVLLITAAPGTAKTKTIVEIARQCADRGERVRVVSATRRAADNVLAMLRHGVDMEPAAGTGSGESLARIVVGTSSRIAAAGLGQDQAFDVLLVNEAERIGLLDLLVHLVNARRAILVGDHRQLRPYVHPDISASLSDLIISSAEAFDLSEMHSLITTSAFELLLEHAPPSHVVSLFRQRRMPSAIASFVSERFYDGKLVTEIFQNENGDSHGALLEAPFTIVDTSDLPSNLRHEMRQPRGQMSRINRAEASLIVRLLTREADSGHRWAVIVPYRGQANYICEMLREHGMESLADVNTIDSFAGMEYESIVFGLTRSNSAGQIGLLSDLRRWNVAMTRATRRLVVVGDMETLTSARDQRVRSLVSDMVLHVQRQGEFLSSREFITRCGDEGRL